VGFHYETMQQLIHSYASHIYTVPLQENYSEELQTPAWLRRTAFRWEQNV